MKETAISTVDKLMNGAVEVWLWVTVGLIGLLAFFGKRLINKWDRVVDSHMPEEEIERRFNSIMQDMRKCQTDITKDYTIEIRKIQSEKKSLVESVDKVHERLDRLMELLVSENGRKT